MKNLKVLYMALVAVAALAFGSCTKDGNYAPGEVATGPQVGFAPTNTTSVSLTGAAGEETLKLVLNRQETAGTLEVGILADCGEYADMFTIPSGVTFEDGKATAEFVIVVDPSKLENDKEYPVQLMIADESQTTPYAYNSWSVTYALFPWELIGVGKFRGGAAVDYLLAIDSSVEVDVNVYAHKSRKGVYMVEDPWTPTFAFGFGYESVEEAAKDGLVFNRPNFVVDCSDPKACFFDLQETAEIGMGPIYVVSVYPKYGDASSAGVLENGVLTFAESTIAMSMPGYSAAPGLYYSNGEGNFRLLLPGAEITDYTLNVAYDGMDVAADNKTAKAKLHFTYGADVTGIKYLIAKGNIVNDCAEEVATLLAGESDAILEVEDFEQGEGSVGVKVAVEPDVYTVIAVALDKDGKVRDSSVTAHSFYFAGIGEQQDTSCVFEGTAGKFSEYMPNLASKYPDYTAIGYNLKGERIVSVSSYLNTSEIVATWTDTPEALVAEYGSPLSSEMVAAINTEAGLTNGWIKLSDNTEYTAILVAKNEFGETKTLILVAKTEPAPYSGELKIGAYTMADPTTESASQFELLSNGGSATNFLVKNLGIVNGAQWHAKYDSAAGTLTLDGTELGYEEDGNQFGSLYGWFNKERNWVYGLMSYATEESTSDSPLVFAVDATNKTLSALKNYAFQVLVLDYGTKQPVGAYGTYMGASTVITYGAASTSAVQAAKLTSVIVPFSSVNMKAASIADRFSVKNRETAVKEFAPVSNIIKIQSVEKYSRKAGISFKENVGGALVR